MTVLPNPAKAVRFELALDQTQPARVYWFEMGMLALRAIEEHFGVPMGPELQARMAAGGFKDTIAVFQAGLLKHMPAVDDQTTAWIMDELGQERCEEIVSQAFDKAFPDAPKAGEGGEAGSPPAPAANRAARRKAAAQSKDG